MCIQRKRCWTYLHSRKLFRRKSISQTRRFVLSALLWLKRTCRAAHGSQLNSIRGYLFEIKHEEMSHIKKCSGATHEKGGAEQLYEG